MDARLGCGLTCVHSLLHLRIRSDMLSELPFVAPLRCCHALMDVLGPCPCGSISRPPTAPFHGAVFVFGGVADSWQLHPSIATKGRDMELPIFRAGQHVEHANGVISRDFTLFSRFYTTYTSSLLPLIPDTSARLFLYFESRCSFKWRTLSVLPGMSLSSPC